MKRFILILTVLVLVVSCLPLALGEGDDGIEETIEDARVLQYGDEGDDVRDLQTRLSKLGYYNGSISGRYREGTQTAVRTLQADFGLEETGIADAQTQAVAYSTLYRPLKYGSSGDDVKRLQRRLTELGYYTGKISGNYLQGTADAVKAFQTKNGGELYPNGIADVATLTVIFSAEAISRSSAASGQAPAATPAPDEIAQVSDGDDGTEVTGDGQVTAEPAVPFTKKVGYKATGKKVKQIQQRLYDLGYYTGNISGNYLGNTRNAVKAFQKQNGLTVDGVVGEGTWNALFNEPDVVGPDATPRPTAAPTPVPFHITVDVNNQAVTVYSRDENGEYTVVVRQMICSTGTKKNPSDVGDWVLSGRKARWCYFPKWGDYAQYWTKINGSIAFHSVIYNSVSTKDLSTKSYHRLGSRASHGCVRLLVADAKWVYDNIPEGTVVTITEKLPDDPELRASLKTPPLNNKTMLPQETPQPTAEPVYVSGALPPLPLTQMKKDSSGEDVYWLQRRLTELGYYHGKCSGTFLGGTQNAVKAFQTDHGLKVTGVADVQTLEAIYADVLTTPAPSATPEPLPAP